VVQRNRVAEKVVAQVRGAIETAIVELKNERDHIDAELKYLIKMYSLGQAAKAKPKKAKPKKVPRGKVKPLARVLLAKHSEVTPAMLAKDANVGLNRANNVLHAMFQAGEIKRLRRGVYGRA
jgi:hypothetical protein